MLKRRIAVTTITATLAFSLLALAMPTAAATAGFHATWVAQSAYATASAGQVVQMSAVYQNSGDEPWVKGTVGRQANFGAGSTKDPLFPRDTNAYANQGWNAGQNWLTPNRFAAQSNDLVATSQLGSWIWAVQVPVGQPSGDVLFHGTPVVDGATWMEDYGFFLKVTVAAGPVTITSTTPASPSTNNRPTVNGTGVGGACTVTILDGGSAIATGTSDSAGNFSIVIGPLAVGGHSLSATADCAGTFKGSGNTFGYVVTATTAGNANGLNVREVSFNFGRCVLPSGGAGQSNTSGSADATNVANWSIDGGAVPITQVTMNSDNASVTILTTAAMANPSGHTVTATGVADCSGQILAAQTLPFTVNDTTGPSMSSATASAVSASTTKSVTVNWNEPVGAAGFPGSCSGTYSINSIAAAPVSGHPSTSPTGQRQCTITSGQELSAGTSYALTSINERDQGNNTQAANPQTISFVVTTLNNFAISFAQGTTETVITITWNGPVTPTTGTATCSSPTTVAIPCANGAPASGSANQIDVTLSSPWSAGGCSGAGQTSCTITILENGVTGPGGTIMSQVSQPVSAALIKDTIAPTMRSTAQVGPSQTVWDITWSEALAGTAPNVCVTAGCPIKIMSGSTVVASTIPGETPTSIKLTGSAGTSSSVTRLTAALPIPGNNYTLTVAAGAVTDASINGNTNAAATANLAVLDTTQPTMMSFGPSGTDCTTGKPCKTFTFTWSERMAQSGSGSVLDPSHYTLNGNAVSGTLLIDAAGTVVTLILTTDAPAGPNNQFVVKDVRDASLPTGQLSYPNPVNKQFNRVL